MEVTRNAREGRLDDELEVVTLVDWGTFKSSVRTLALVVGGQCASVM